jgi:hypothetical protein
MHSTRTQLRTKQGWIGADLCERKILKLIAVHGLHVTFRSGRRILALGNGWPVGSPFSLERAIERGWIEPDPAAPALIEGTTAQRYKTAGAVKAVGHARRAAWLRL